MQATDRDDRYAAVGEDQAATGSGDPVRSFDPADLGPSRFSNRETSWLAFASRLLDLVADRALPLLERVKFMAIFSEGMDEFFQVRVAGLEDQVDAGVRTRQADGMRPQEVLDAVRSAVIELMRRQDALYYDELIPSLEEVGISVSDWSTLGADQQDYLNALFERDIFPVLTPLSVDPGHPFPYISNLSLNLMVYVADQDSDEERIARVKVPPSLPRFLSTPDGVHNVALEQVIAAQLQRLFPGMEVGDTCFFRVTRNSDLNVAEDEADDLLDAVELELHRRRFGAVARLEVQAGMPDRLREILRGELALDEGDIYESAAPLGLGGLWALYSLDRPDLHEETWSPTTPYPLADGAAYQPDLFSAVRREDLLVHHPYDSFAASVEAFLSQAAADPQVVAIKQTLYRTSGDSPIVSSLVDAARAGKQVAAVIELKARFDEENNISWARTLEEAGVHVVYGIAGLKVHSKTLLVARREDDGIRRYCHVGTGNYNPKTARTYEDLGLLSADPQLVQDVGDLFNFLTGFSKQVDYGRLVVSPAQTRKRLIELIQGEQAKGESGRIVMKVNGLTDVEIIDALYRASSAGVRTDLIVRGVCSLRPQVPQLSESIRVKSIVGRFLEHSRIYAFGQEGDVGRVLLIGSADLMERNLDRRIEALVPLSTPATRARVEEVLSLCLADDVSSWCLGPDGMWSKEAAIAGVSVQRELQQLALSRVRANAVH